MVVGQTIHAVGARQTDGSLVAMKLQIKDDATDGEFVIEGSLGGFKGTCPTISFGVNGYTVKTSAETVWLPAPGTKCQDFNKSGIKVGVKGHRQADGSVLASEVTKK